MHTSYILTEKGNVINRSTTRPLTKNELETEEVKRRMHEYTLEMESNIGNYSTATMRNHEEYGENPFDDIFQNDALDDENLDSQEVDEQGESINQPNLDNMAETQAPLAENSDEHIGISVDLIYPR